MNKKDKRKIVLEGYELLRIVESHPEEYEVMLGCYTRSSLIGKLIGWYTQASKPQSIHVSDVYVHLDTHTPFVEIHALLGYGVVPTPFGAVAKDKTTIEIRRVQGVRPTAQILAADIPKLSTKADSYQKPFHFVTKSRTDDPNKWFCSEKCNNTLRLQNREDHLCPPVWLQCSPLAEELYGYYRNGHFEVALNSKGSA